MAKLLISINSTIALNSYSANISRRNYDLLNILLMTTLPLKKALLI